MCRAKIRYIPCRKSFERVKCSAVMLNKASPLNSMYIMMILGGESANYNKQWKNKEKSESWGRLAF